MAQLRRRTDDHAAWPIPTAPSFSARWPSMRDDGSPGNEATSAAYGRLHAALRASRFAVTAEIGPPRRMRGVPPDRVAEEGMRLAVELVERSGLPHHAAGLPLGTAAEGDR